MKLVDKGPSKLTKVLAEDLDNVTVEVEGGTTFHLAVLEDGRIRILLLDGTAVLEYGGGANVVMILPVPFTSHLKVVPSFPVVKPGGDE